MAGTERGTSSIIKSGQKDTEASITEHIFLEKSDLSFLKLSFLRLRVTAYSLLIHAFTYSLYIGPCSVACNMTSYSHSYHSIKFIHCSAPQRDVLRDKMVL